MVAYLIRISTWVFGNNAFAIRFFGCLVGPLTIWMLSSVLVEKQLLACLLFTPVYFWGSCLMTPDIPFLFFWTAYLVWLIGINRTLHNWSEDPISRVYRARPIWMSRWFVGGCLLGLGLLSKYTMSIALVCSFLVFWSKYRAGAWIRGFLFHLLVALTFVVPVLIFNIQHCFEPLRFQWEHSMSSQPGSWSHFYRFLGSQVALIGMLPILLLPIVVIRWRSYRSDPMVHTSAYFFAIPFLWILYRSFQWYLEANWSLMCYVSFWGIAEATVIRSSFRYLLKFLYGFSFFVPWVISALLFVHLWTPIPALSPKRDRLRKFQSQLITSKDIASVLRLRSEPVFTTEYQWTGYLRYQNIGAYQLAGVGRSSQYVLESPVACDFKSILLLAPDDFSDSTVSCFPNRRVVAHFPVTVRGDTVSQMKLIEYTK